jgi:formylglycine-generating enzyme required for sulfatase activity
MTRSTRATIPLYAVAAAAALAALAACSKAQDAQTPKVDPAELQQRIDALKARTLKHLVFVEGGSFMMGDFGEIHSEEKLPYSGNPDDNPLHKVTLDSYSISAYKTTYEDFDVFTDAMGKPRIATADELDVPLRSTPGTPAGVSWQEARDYCQWLGQKVGVPMDLPTEVQWEYAARSRGQMVIYPTDNGLIDDGRNVASYQQREAYEKKHGVFDTSPHSNGQFPPNALGLYDMVTNGYEWVLDWYAADYYGTSPENNPGGPASGTQKVTRGYHGLSGDSLRIVSTTFMRHPVEPTIAPDTDKDGTPYKNNPHRSFTTRCVANHTQRVSSTR